MSSDQLTPTCSATPFQAKHALSETSSAHNSRKATTRRLSFWKAARDLNVPGRPAALGARMKFFLRASLLSRRISRTWFDIFSTQNLSPLIEAQPRLALKLQRPFMSVAWGERERFAALRAHYEILQEIFPADVLKKIYTDGFDFAQIVNTTTNRRLFVRFSYRNQFEREGELTLSLVDVATGVTLVNATFCLSADEHGARRMYIGGLQACCDPRVRPIIHDLAKEMHGLRAKALVLWCLQQFGAMWGVRSIHAVDDAHHVSNYRNRRHCIAASYDEFWAESDGERNAAAAGCWEIPLQPRQRSREELKPSRRKQHERRYAFLADLRCTLQSAVDHYLQRVAGTASKELFDAAEFFYASAAEALVLPAVASCGAEKLLHASESMVSVAGIE